MMFVLMSRGRNSRTGEKIKDRKDRTCITLSMRNVNSNATEVHRSPAKLSKYADKNAVATSWMMAQARGDRDVPSEPLGNFYWSMRQVTNACNFARGGKGDPRGNCC